MLQFGSNTARNAPEKDGSNSDAARRVVWDEQNLEHNKAYFDANPVTKHIDEPKTPYEPDRAMDEEGNFVDSDDEAAKLARNPRQYYDEHGNLISHPHDHDTHHKEGGGGVGGWDEETKSFARRARISAPVVAGVVGAASSSTTFYGSREQYDSASSPDQSDFKKRRTQMTGDASFSSSLKGGLSLTLGAHPTEEEIKARDAAQHEAEFKHMRKAVYADEGAKFREQLRLAKLQAEKDEEEDDEVN